MSAEESSETGLAEEDLCLANAKAFARFLHGPEVNGSAKLLMLSKVGTYEKVQFSIEVPIPQYPKADIRGSEIVEVIFGEGEPMVFALRADFPRLPHQNLPGKGFPRWLCLNATSWSETKHRWCPSAFLESIRNWLIKATLGELHAPGQPREPLFVNPAARMIVGDDFDLVGADGLSITGDLEYKPYMLWAKPLAEGGRPGQGNFKLFTFRIPSREHGVIDICPKNLLELHELCEAQGFDLLTELSEKLRSIAPTGRVEDTIFGHQMLLYIQQQLTPGAGSEETTEEEWAFVVMDANIQQVAEILGVSTSVNGTTARVVIPGSYSPADTNTVKIEPIAILRSMTPDKARTYNGIALPFPRVAVLGAGAIGSKVLDSLARSGLERGVIIDDDRLYPHNTARHELPGTAVGFPKSTSLAVYLNALLDGSSADFKGLVGRYCKLQEKGPVKEAIQSADFILDFSASVGVARDLSLECDVPRTFSAFLTPGGDTMIVHCEDVSREIRLDWLEAITLRAIYLQADLKFCYTSKANEIWYGGGCREVSTVLPDFKVSIFAAMAANAFTNRHSKKEAFCAAYVLDPQTMAVTPVEITASSPIEIKREDWTIRYDAELVENLQKMRAERLPNETGGILIGVFDRERKICSVVMASNSPPDSKSWPTEYIRGVAGLKDLVKRIADRTAGQLQYVGEWHSHPPGYSTSPSDLDRDAVANLKIVLGREGCPAVAFIIGDDLLPYVLFDQQL